MDELTGSQFHLTGADAFLLQNDLPNCPQPSVESNNSETLESNIISQSLDFKDWVAHVQTAPVSRSRLTMRSSSLFQQPAKHSALWAKLSKQARAAVSGQSMIEISEIDILTGDGKTFWGGYLDNPKEGDRIYGSATAVSGWAIGRQAKAMALRITFRGETIAEAPINVARPDVKKAYSFSPDAQQSGFSLNLDFQGLPPEGKLEVKAVLSDQTVQSISDFKFTRYAALFQ